MCSVCMRPFVAYAYWNGHRPLASAGFWEQEEMFHVTAALPRTTNFIPKWQHVEDINDFKENSFWSENPVHLKIIRTLLEVGEGKGITELSAIDLTGFESENIIVSCSRSFRMRWFGPSSSTDVRLLLTGYNVTFAAGTSTGASLSLDVVTAISADKLCVFSWIHNRLSNLRLFQTKWMYRVLSFMWGNGGKGMRG